MSNKTSEPLQVRRKNTIGCLILILIPILWTCFSAYREQHWAQRVASDMFQGGWSVAAVDRVQELSTPLDVWRFFSPPITGIAFVKLNTLTQMTDDIRAIPSCIVRMDGYTRGSWYVHDCSSGRFGYVDVDGPDAFEHDPDFDISGIRWFEPEFATDSKLHRNLGKFVCKWKYDNLIPHPNSQLDSADKNWPELD